MNTSWISSILPTIASLLGGPLGGAAVEAAGRALGLSDATADKVQRALTSGQLSADQMAALQAADLQLKTRMAELGIDAEKVAQADRESARSMQKTTGSWVPSALACVVTVGYFGILLGLMTGDLKLWDNSAMTLLLGALTSAWGSIVAFFYGASHGAPPEVKK
jgi:diacylglycerol kinase family enzyme